MQDNIIENQDVYIEFLKLTKDSNYVKIDRDLLKETQPYLRLPFETIIIDEYYIYSFR